jgi:hypothetical protein
MTLLLNRCAQRSIPFVVFVVSFFLGNQNVFAQCLGLHFQPDPTFAERLSKADVSFVVRWVKSQKSSDGGRMAYRIQKIVKGDQIYKVGRLIIVDDYRETEPNDTCLLLDY